MGGECRERSPRGSGVSGGSLAPVRAFISPPPQDPECPAWSGRRGPTQQPPLAPPGTGQEDRGSRRASPQVKDHALWLSVAVFSAGPSIPTLGQQPSPWEGGMLPNRKHEPRTCPPAAPPGPSLPPSPNSHSRDGPEQRWPGLHGSEATRRQRAKGPLAAPAPGTPGCPALVRGGRGWPAEGRGAPREETGSCSFYISNQDPEPGRALPQPRGRAGTGGYRGLTRQEADVRKGDCQECLREGQPGPWARPEAAASGPLRGMKEVFPVACYFFFFFSNTRGWHWG